MKLTLRALAPSRRSALLLGIAIVSIPVWLGYRSYRNVSRILLARLPIGSTMPDFRILDGTGREIQLRAALGGRPSVLAFIKLDCPNCHWMLELLEKDPGVRSGAIQVLAVAQPPKDLSPAPSLHCPVFIDPDQSFHTRAGGLAVPLVYLIDAHGRVVGLLEGLKSEAAVATAMAVFRQGEHP